MYGEVRIQRKRKKRTEHDNCNLEMAMGTQNGEDLNFDRTPPSNDKIIAICLVIHVRHCSKTKNYFKAMLQGASDLLSPLLPM